MPKVKARRHKLHNKASKAAKNGSAGVDVEMEDNKSQGQLVSSY